MDPTDFLNFAKKFRYSSDEASIRTAISRAYYYVYHYMRILRNVRKKGLLKPQKTT